MRGKKGEEEGSGTLVVIIAIAVAAIVLFVFAGKLRAKVTEGSDIEACRLSVIAQSKTKILGSPQTALKCKRREVRLYDNKVIINGEKETKYKFSELNNDILNEILADELRLCWYQMAEGKFDVFGDPLTGFSATDENVKVCAICSEIYLDSSLKNNNFLGLKEFLKTKKIKTNKIYGQDLSYWDYLIREQKVLREGQVAGIFGQQDGDTDNIEAMVLSKGRSYSVYFKALKLTPAISKPLHGSLGVLKVENYISFRNPKKVLDDCGTIYN